MSQTGSKDTTKLLATKDYAQFVILMKLKMKFSFSAIAQNV